MIMVLLIFLIKKIIDFNFKIFIVSRYKYCRVIIDFILYLVRCSRSLMIWVVIESSFLAFILLFLSRIDFWDCIFTC